MNRKIRVGTRMSRLALWQADFVVRSLQGSFPGYEFETVPIITRGDKLLDVSLDKVGDKGFFTKELELALLHREVDIAVHSLKDYPTEVTEGLIIAAVTVRHDPREALISKNGETFFQLSPGARVGTSSLRRKAQLLHWRPDLQLVDLRGNVDTRVKKLETGEYDAVVLAAAGVERLGLREKIVEKLDSSICLPAAGQGALGVETRKDDPGIIDLVRTVNDPVTHRCVTAERALLQALGGGCQVPVGALAVERKGVIFLEAMVGTLDGTLIIRDSIAGEREAPGELGKKLAQKLVYRGAGRVLQQIRQEQVS